MTTPLGLSHALRRNALSKIRTTAAPSSCTRTLFTSSASPAPAPTSRIKTGAYATAFALSAGLFAVYYFDARSALHRYFLTPVLRYAVTPENGHKIAVRVLRTGWGPKDPVGDDERLKVELWGEELSNPVGLAAGFDKNGEAVDGLFDLGFSWVEIGSVTPKPQPGNPQPRVFHLPEDSSLINRYGFPSEGQASVLSRLRARLPDFLSTGKTASLRDGAMLAVNLGKNKTSPANSIEDFISGVRTFGPYSDVLVINVSSPNTPGLRGLQNRRELEDLLNGVTKARDSLPNSVSTSKKPKLLLKIAPDLDEAQLHDIADVIRNSNIDGVIVSNTTVQRPNTLINANKAEVGGLSGTPLKPYSLKALRTLRGQLPANIPLIGCGGISTGEDALEFARQGASMVQVYTGFGYDGVGACRRIKDQLTDALAKEGKTWTEVVKKAVDELSYKGKPAGKDKPADGSVEQLIAEALELQGLLDKLGATMGDSDVHTKREGDGSSSKDGSCLLGAAEAIVV